MREFVFRTKYFATWYRLAVKLGDFYVILRNVMCFIVVLTLEIVNSEMGFV